MSASDEDFMNLFDTKLEKKITQHLRNVYACLATCVVAAGAGASVPIFTDFLRDGVLALVGALIFFVLLMYTPDDHGDNLLLRAGYLYGFCGSMGVLMGPLFSVVLEVDPLVIVTAFVVTTLVFTSFTLCAIFSESGHWLYLGGPLLTLLTTLLYLNLINIFLGSVLLYKVDLYLGLLVMCGYVLYDTQLIIEARRLGNKDYVLHSMTFFLDFFGIFVRLLEILVQNRMNYGEEAEQD